MRKLGLFPVAMLAVLFMASCAAKPQLLPRNGINANAIDLSGRWVLRRESGAPVAMAGAEEQTIVIPRNTSRSSRTSPRQSPRSRSDGSAVHVFLESGTSLKITQTLHGIFISFDRAIVEEFTFGENRTVSVGPIEAQRVSGWDVDQFIAETMDEKGAVLAERWSLAESGAALVRTVTVVEKEEIVFSTTQIFDREEIR
jgi:hypothetical protein